MHLLELVTKWNTACDKKVGETDKSSQVHLRYTDNFVDVGDKASECKLGVFHDADVARYLTD